MFLEKFYEKRNKQMIVMSVFYISSESGIKIFLINKYYKDIRLQDIFNFIIGYCLNQSPR